MSCEVTAGMMAIQIFVLFISPVGTGKLPGDGV